MNIIPATPEMLRYTGLLDHAEMHEFLELWPGQLAVMDDGQPFGAVSIRQHDTEPFVGVGNVWIIPNKRGHWMTGSNLSDLCKYIFTYFPTYIASATETRCERFYRRLGFEKYCQQDNVSYYSLTKERAMSGIVHA